MFAASGMLLCSGCGASSTDSARNAFNIAENRVNQAILKSAPGYARLSDESSGLEAYAATDDLKSSLQTYSAHLKGILWPSRARADALRMESGIANFVAVISAARTEMPYQFEVWKTQFEMANQSVHRDANKLREDLGLKELPPFGPQTTVTSGTV